MASQKTIRHRTAAALLAFTLAATLITVVVGLPQRAAAAQVEFATDGWSTDGIVWDLVRVGDTVYIGGDFSQIQDENGNVLPRSNLAAFDAATGAPLTWAPIVDNEVRAMEVASDGSIIYIGGNFHRVNGRYRQRMAAVDPVSGSTVSSFRANTSGRVLELILIDDHLYLGGELISVDGKTRNRLARVDRRSGQLDTDWNPSVNDGSVRGLESSPNGDRLYVGGTFSSIDGVWKSSHLAAIDLDGAWPGDAVDKSWRPDLDQPVFDMVATGDDVYMAVAGPGFENNRLQKHSATTAEEKLRYLADGDVQDLELDGNILYVGGHFEKVFGGQPRNQLAAIDIRDDHITDVAPDVVTRYGVWKALAGPEGLWLGGEFTEIEGKPRQGFGFLSADELAEPTGEMLLARGAQWRYDDSGSQPSSGTQWAQRSWDDGNWKTGRAQLGFGDGDENTVTAETDALYARTSLDIADPAKFDSYTIRVLADAGAAIYVNGTEVARNNLPNGQLDGETLALEGRWTTGERTYSQHSVSRSYFRAGSNTIAVEVHGAYDWPGDLSFDLELLGVDFPADDPGDGDHGDGNGNPDDGGPDGGGPDGDATVATTTVIPRGADWRYLDDGSAYGTTWMSQTFDDAAWKTGRAEMGFGDGDEATELTQGHIGYRFRHQIDLSNGDAGNTEDTGPISDSYITLLADDGAVIYVNGTEVARYNMPANASVGRWTKALESKWGDDELTYRRFDVDPELLIDGVNTIAVSVHNLWTGGADLSFDLDLTVERPIVQPPAAGPVTLVAGDAPWSYLDDGSKLGQDWMTPSFNDGSWSTGSGRFGFGDGAETTALAAGHASYYFRHQFSSNTIPNELTLNLLFDDGAVAYLNGVEVARRNMPAGPINWWTTAATARWGDAENIAETISIDPAMLVAGVNTLAISVHNKWTGNGDLSMAADLTGYYEAPVPDPEPEPEPAPDPEPWSPKTVVATDATWRYSDWGSSPGLDDLGQVWTATSFDDGNWPTGAAPLGFGQGDEATVVTKWNKAYYFRNSFTIEPGQNLMPTGLIVRLLVDDGAAVYLNGTEIVRQNLPAGTLTFDSAPLATVWGDDERDYTRYELPADLLIEGENVVAVQAHNYTAGNSDFSFGLELIAE